MDNFNLVLTFFTAFVATRIAFNQMKTDKYRLMHDLFDRRMEVYHSTYKLLDSLCSQNKLDEEVFHSILNGKDKSHFLFSKDVYDKIDDYHAVVFEHRYLYGFERNKFETEVSKKVRNILNIEDRIIIDTNLHLNGIISAYARIELNNLTTLFKNDMSFL